jgi:hypothetical protein
MQESTRLILSPGPYVTMPQGKRPTHPTIKTNQHGDQLFCGYTWCRGECGLPALFMKYEGPQAEGPTEFRAHGSMVANGPVWQRNRWNGERVYYTPPDAEKALKMWWV